MSLRVIYLRENWGAATADGVAARWSLNEDDFVVFLWSDVDFFLLNVHVFFFFGRFVNVKVFRDLWLANLHDWSVHNIAAA